MPQNRIKLKSNINQIYQHYYELQTKLNKQSQHQPYKPQRQALQKQPHLNQYQQTKQHKPTQSNYTTTQHRNNPQHKT